MKYQECEINEKELFCITAHNHWYADPYDGCEEACPFCYWNSIPGWQGHIWVRTNAAKILETFLTDWKEPRRVCIGHRCDPYGSAEKQYHLTRAMLEVLHVHGIPFLLTTSSPQILEDIELLASMAKQAVIVIELSRIRRMLTFRNTGHHATIESANKLRRLGIRVLATLSPYLPGITDVDMILRSLDENIPLYLGCLDTLTDPLTASRILSEIQVCAPELLLRYKRLLEGSNVQLEFSELKKQYLYNKRIKSFPLDIEYGP